MIVCYTPPPKPTDDSKATAAAAPLTPSTAPVPLKTVRSTDIERPYTPLRYDADSFDLVVKTYEKGLVSRYLYELSVGSIINVMGPAGGFSYTPGQYNHRCIIAAGTGIAPLYQLIHRIVNDNSDTQTRITLLYANRRPCDILLLKELELCVAAAATASSAKQLTMHHILSGADSTWNGLRGRITPSILQSIFGTNFTNGMFLFFFLHCTGLA
jgi:cytochrome-b5 reductase